MSFPANISQPQVEVLLFLTNDIHISTMISITVI